ncbi:MAG TPA: amino acid ABC transporter permease [Chloroflexota bacterium]|jgi:putative glutamine transport system permease protein|nr:amino acid ABC transporter permease [Chloroflexota bacterium]
MGELFRPQLWAPFLDAGIWRFLLTGLQTTLSMAAIAIAGSLVLGLFIAICRLSPFLVLRLPAIVFIALIRAVPVLLIVFFTFFGAARAGLGLDPFGAGTLALTVYTAAVNAEIMRAGITSIDRGQLEAARSLGLSYGQMMRYVVLPQALRRMVPPQVSQLITLTKDTSLTAVIGVGELTRRGQIIYQGETNPLQTLFVVACIYFAVNYGLSRFSRRWELATGGAMGGRAAPGAPPA